MKNIYTIKELAEELGVNWQTVSSWKRKRQIPSAAINADGTYTRSKLDSFVENFMFDGTLPEPETETKKSKPASKKAAAKKPATADVDLDEFIRRYWQEGTRAVDVLMLPQETAAIILEHVNDALRYAYGKLK